MDGPAGGSGSTPPPPPPHNGTPPTSSPKILEARTSPGYRPSATASGSPPRRPQLAREGSQRGSFVKRRDRTHSNHSVSSSQGGGGSRVGSLPRPRFDEHYFPMGDQPAPTDSRLILASLGSEPLEDEAEATLLDVLERRQVTFAAQAAAAPVRHRRGRSLATPGLATPGIPNIDLLRGIPSTQPRPSSASSPAEALQQPLSRPPLARGLSSTGRSRRNLLQGSPPSIGGRVASADWAFDSQGQLSRSFSGPSNPDAAAEAMLDSSPRGTTHKSTSQEGDEGRSPKQPTTIPLALERGISNSSGPTGLSTPGERARYVAMTMKAAARNSTADEATVHSSTIADGELSTLVNILEAKREDDERSAGGSVRKSGNSRNGGSQSGRSNGGSRSGRSRFSDSSKTGGSSYAGFKSKRPFSGITSPFANDGFMSNVDQLFEVAEHVQELCQIPEEEADGDAGDLAQVNANFLSSLVSSHPEVLPLETEGIKEGLNVEGGGGVDEQTPMLQQNAKRFNDLSPARRMTPNRVWSLRPNPNSRLGKILMWWSDLRKQMQMLAVAFDLPFVKERMWSFIQNEVSMFIVPCIAVSAFFYYSLNNPVLKVADASVSWLILFVIRHYLTLQLAQVAEYLVVDVMAMRSLVSVQLIGPLATLYTINSKGWPFVFTVWGMLNFLLIQESPNGNNPFFSHWFFWTEIELFADNPGGGVVQSDTYMDILLCMIIAGVATSVKRTVLALYLGKRIYIHYKPKLEKVMESMILLTEVADLGEAIDDFEFVDMADSPAEGGEGRRSATTRQSSTRQSSMLSDKVRSSTMNAVVKKQDAVASASDSDEDESKEGSADGSSTPWNRLRGDSISSDESQDTLENASQEIREKATDKKEDKADALPSAAAQEHPVIEDLPAVDEDVEPPVTAIHEPVTLLTRERTTTSHIKSLLDNWEEPVNKQDKAEDPSIHQILEFRKALSFLDDTHPFGSSFGPAFTRDSCIKSAKLLYKRLLALSPGDPVLHFDIIGVLAYNIDGTFDQAKAKGLVRLFRPDKFDTVSLLAFVASCDGVYKKLRYLRASVGNSTLIDSVLENIFNGVFYFFLALVILAVLQLKPWTLLATMSTVLVSFAFALGPSAAKIIEGMIMIAVRRPFDLGDRISIVDTNGSPDNSDDPGYHDTWLVEDCNLFSTTLRLSRSNELSTVNNGAIAYSRIVNHGRSANALVNITLRVDISATHEQIQIVKSALEQNIRDHPRTWSKLINFRITRVDPANTLIVYTARVQHVKTWQDLTSVLQARGNLEKFLCECLMKLGIHYEAEVLTSEVRVKELPDQPIFDAPFPDGLPTMPAEPYAPRD